LLEHERQPAVFRRDLSFELAALEGERTQDPAPSSACTCALAFVGQVVEMAGKSPAGLSAKGEGLGPEVVELIERRDCGRG